MPFGWGKKSEAAPPDLDQLAALERALPGDPGASGPATTWSEQDTVALLGREFPLYTAFLSQRAQSSIGGGLLRFFLPGTTPSLNGWAKEEWHEDWPSLPGGVAFASDWMGRLYLFTRGKGKKGEPAMALLAPAVLEYVDLDYDFAELLGTEFPSEWRELLQADYADEWRALGNPMPAFDQCVSPKVPLQLGGSDDPDKCELTPLVVAISIAGQIWEQTKDLPPGTSIPGVSIS